MITDRRGGKALGGVFKEIETHTVRAGGIAGKRMIGLLKSAPEMAVGCFQAWNLLRRLNPNAVIGFGGYAAVPTMMAATYGGYATAIHEQNALLGRANRLLAPKVDRIATSFERLRGMPEEAANKAVHTGMPVRDVVIAMRDCAYNPPDKEGRINLLVTGGSQGAHVFSAVVPQAVAQLPETLRNRLDITQQCRPEDIDGVRAFYAQNGMRPTLAIFFDDIPDRLGAAHLLIGRAGASTIAELTAVGRPAVLVPYPSAIDDHQSANAHALDEVGAGWLMPESAFTPSDLAAQLETLLTSPVSLAKAAAASRAAGRPDAAARLADLVLDLISNGDDASDRRAA
jgi:UDP-N-acetylglucosamine--N-acetylmuramyl-(pentapeptide) pyrophosphoryl-undecaprenol N-acetylglucosamine transferase